MPAGYKQGPSRLGAHSQASLTCDRGLPLGNGSWSVEPQMWEAPVLGQRTSVGLDVHVRSVAACGIDGHTGEVWERRLTADHGEIVELALQIARRRAVAMHGLVAGHHIDHHPRPTGIALSLTIAGSRGGNRLVHSYTRGCAPGSARPTRRRGADPASAGSRYPQRGHR